MAFNPYCFNIVDPKAYHLSILNSGECSDNQATGEGISMQDNHARASHEKESISAPPLTRSMSMRVANDSTLKQRDEGCANEHAFLESGSAGDFLHDGNRYEIERIRFRGPPAGHDPISIGIFAGIHGDEPAGVTALRLFLSSLLENPIRATGYELFAYPVVNPVGLERGTRGNCSGLDLNREFWKGSKEPEIVIIENELRSLRLSGLIALHADDSCEGTYGYSHGNTMEDSLLKPALIAAEQVLPRDRRASIDGFHAHEGVICDCFPGILAPPPEHKPRPFNVIFETPARASLELQSAAHVAALDAILATYRGYMSYANHL